VRPTGWRGEKGRPNAATKPELPRSPALPDTISRRLGSIFHQHQLKFENLALFSVSLNIYPMTSNHNLRLAKLTLNFGTGTIPVLGFGTLIPDLAETKIATTNALRVGFRHLDCAERYRNEREVGESLAAEFATGTIAREDVFITTKLWNTNHRPERVEPGSTRVARAWESVTWIFT
jgi:Aldo/keto reductase family